MTNLHLTVFGMTHPGRVRTNNEDAFVVADLGTTERVHAMTASASFEVGERGVLAAVSDGMGGAQSGEVASTLALRALRVGMGEGSLDGAGAALQNSVKGANEHVWGFARATGKLGMGATLTAMLVHGGYAYIAEVGDSRAYLLRGDVFVQLTHDQSYVQFLVDRGTITREQAGVSDYKNIVLQALGTHAAVDATTIRVALRRHDRFLLCSDGLTNMVSDPDLHALLRGASPEAVCTALIETANARGGQDNITAVVVDVDGEGVPTTTAGERISVEAIPPLRVSRSASPLPA